MKPIARNIPVAGSLVVLLTATFGQAAEVDYERDVKPILRERCYGCHGGLKQEAGLRLDTGQLIRTGGESGPAVVPRLADDSLLLQRVRESDPELRMPPEGKPLTADEIETLASWIVGGASSPGDEQPEDDPRDHWAFRVPERPALPRVPGSHTIRNAIDVFIAARHSEAGLQPVPTAKKNVLLRRVFLNLIGLPPSRDALHSFANDGSPDALEKVVDRLLGSPAHGERWGRHWMDVWRYSDWYGRRRVPDVLNSYGQIWRWRDWIIRSVNEGKGYDRMVMQMLAADEIDPDDLDNVVATGFIVRNFYRWNYNTWMKDSIEHTGKAFLGITLNCCHCHDHKYDPITQEEYFRFRAFFEPIEIRHDRVPGEPDPGPYPKYSYGAAYKPMTSGLVRIVDEKLDAKTFMYSGGEARNIIPDRPPVLPGPPAVLGGSEFTTEEIALAPTAWYPGLRPFVRREELGRRQSELQRTRDVLAKAEALVADAERKLAAARSATGSEAAGGATDSSAITNAEADLQAARLTLNVDTANLASAESELAAIQARILADDIRFLGHDGNADVASKNASRAERQSALDAARVELARAERAKFAAERKQTPDDPKSVTAVAEAKKLVATKSAAVDRAAKQLETESTKYTPLSPEYPKRSTGRRLALARWIADTDNPLTARVAVNHIWRGHFGRAFVESTENLGRNGDRPTHPKLIDWLAVETMHGHWDMKRIHRLVIGSETWRMSSRSDRAAADNRERDRDNRLLWHFNAARMPAEAVRDSILAVASNLDSSIGGKEIAQSDGLRVPRRSVYFDHHGEGRMPFLDLFDAADPCDCYRRSESVRPQQALAMTNSDLALNQGRLLARSMSSTGDNGQQLSDAEFVNMAFERLLSRMPSDEERIASESFLRSQAELFRDDPDDGTQPGSKDAVIPPSTDTNLRARESFIQALFSHSDFITIR